MKSPSVKGTIAVGMRLPGRRAHPLILPKIPYSGFTLVELLVVIGIMAVLIAMVIPAMSYGTFRARVTTCAGNYRQWTVAVAL
ncbi:MAG: type II secretion system protein, partial [Limisphaerales bacterium]